MNENSLHCLVNKSNISSQVLKFSDEAARHKFVRKMKKLLKLHGKALKKQEDTESALYQRAMTKEKRQEMLSHFFKKVFAEVSLDLGFWSGSGHPNFRVNFKTISFYT